MLYEMKWETHNQKRSYTHIYTRTIYDGTATDTGCRVSIFRVSFTTHTPERLFRLTNIKRKYYFWTNRNGKACKKVKEIRLIASIFCSVDSCLFITLYVSGNYNVHVLHIYPRYKKNRSMHQKWKEENDAEINEKKKKNNLKLERKKMKEANYGQQQQQQHWPVIVYIVFGILQRKGKNNTRKNIQFPFIATYLDQFDLWNPFVISIWFTIILIYNMLRRSSGFVVELHTYLVTHETRTNRSTLIIVRCPIMDRWYKLYPSIIILSWSNELPTRPSI